MATENELDGWLILNKPIGMPSFRATSRARRLLGVKKAGHCGTLDPFAEGVLPIALGRATKVIPWLAKELKEYDFTLKWGKATDSGDVTGSISESGGKNPSANEIRKVLPSFLGETMQTPPIYSAVKVGGKRAYQLARQGQTPKLEPRPVFIEKLELVAHDLGEGGAVSRLFCRCGSGTYVRSLAVSLARRLKTLCYVEKLTRLAVGDFNLSHTITLDFLQSVGHSEAKVAVWPIAVALKRMPKVTVSPAEASSLAKGVSVAVSVPGGGFVRAECGGRLVAIGKSSGDDGAKGLKPVRVFFRPTFETDEGTEG